MNIFKKLYYVFISDYYIRCEVCSRYMQLNKSYLSYDNDYWYDGRPHYVCKHCKRDGWE